MEKIKDISNKVNFISICLLMSSTWDNLVQRTAFLNCTCRTCALEVSLVQGFPIFTLFTFRTRSFFVACSVLYTTGPQPLGHELVPVYGVLGARSQIGASEVTGWLGVGRVSEPSLLCVYSHSPSSHCHLGSVSCRVSVVLDSYGSTNPIVV